MKIGTRLRHTVTGEVHEFVADLGLDRLRVRSPDSRLATYHKRFLSTDLVHPRKLLVRVVVDGEAEPYVLEALPWGRGRPAVNQPPKRVRIVDQSATWNGLAVWKNWLGVVLTREEYQLA